MKSGPFLKGTKNRPVSIRRPVLLLFTFLLIFAPTCLIKTNPVHAGSSPGTMNITPNPVLEDFKVPESGEPVILSPGNDARIMSPLMLKLATRPGDDGMIRVELLGHDNRLIFRKLLDYGQYKGKTLLIEQEIPFEIRSEESARLQVILENSKGKPIFLTSVHLTLINIHGTETAGDDVVFPRFMIEQPAAGETVQGEFLVIKGGIKPINNTPIVVELIASDWHTLTSKIVGINIPADRTAYTPIEVKLPYKTSTQIPATLRIRQESSTLINGTVLLWSEMVTLVK